jgi:phosphopantetheinyl transferase
VLPADIEILADEDGRPTVEAPAVVSLAHSRGECVALVAAAGVGVGIDIEHLRPSPEGFAEAALTPEERLLASTDEWVLRCWCAKEAAGKAFGSGMSPLPTVVSIDAERGRVVVAVGDARLEAATARDGDLIVATAVRQAP